MRHTRNRQCMKLCKDKKLAKRMFKGQKNYPIKHMTGEFKLGKEIDPTFKWHRELYPWGHNYVEFEKEVPVPPGRIEKRAILRRAK